MSEVAKISVAAGKANWLAVKRNGVKCGKRLFFLARYMTAFYSKGRECAVTVPQPMMTWRAVNQELCRSNTKESRGNHMSSAVDDVAYTYPQYPQYPQ